MKVFFDIPVYRVSRERYESKQQSFIEQEMAAEGNPLVAKMYSRDPGHKKSMERHFGEVYGGCWRFNEVIGFIRLYFFFTQIRGQYWRMNAKRITRTRKKIFALFADKVGREEEVPSQSTNSEVYSLVQKYLARARNEHYLKKFHIDTSVLEFAGPFIDWNGLMRASSLQT